MITKDAIKAEIDHTQKRDIKTVYKLIRVFTLSTEQRNQSELQTAEEEESVEKRKAQFFKFVTSHSFKLPANSTFNREELYDR
jgi:hypothetical protein